MKPETKAFDISTELFFNSVIEAHLKCHMESYTDRYFIEGSYTYFSSAGWQNILQGLMEEIEYQLSLGKERKIRYPYQITIIKGTIDPKRYTVTLLIMDLETECILESTIKVVVFDRLKFGVPRSNGIKPKMSAKITVKNKIGEIGFDLKQD